MVVQNTILTRTTITERALTGSKHMEQFQDFTHRFSPPFDARWRKIGAFEGPKNDLTNSHYLSVTRLGLGGKSVRYDIIWSDVYDCPVVYMACYTDSEPVTLLDEFFRFMKSLQVDITPDIGITQGEHPLTGLPVFFLHPCRTNEVVGVLQEVKEDKAEIWMDVYGRMVGLRVDESVN